MVSHTHLLPALGAINDSHILCVGDVMLDRFVYGDVARISPEAPVPVLAITSQTTTAGGMGNAALNLSALGAHTTIVSVTGDDQNAIELDGILEGRENLTPRLLRDPSRPTPLKTRYVAGGQQIMRADEERVAPLSSDFEDQLLKTVQGLLPAMQAVVISDYGKGVLTSRVLLGVIAAANKQKIPVVVDPKGSDYSRYRGCDVITPNLKELREATGMPAANDTDIETASMALIKSTGIPAVIVKRAEGGVSLVQKKGDAVHLRAAARHVRDVSGAGDTFIAALAASLAAGAQLDVAADIANRAAGLAVEKIGTSVVSAGELRSALSANDAHSHVWTWEQAKAQRAQWQAEGLKVGFTNGCFDILHQGHVVMLELCARECDRLIVGVNYDSSVRRLKGPTRPVNDERARALVIASLASVDGVVFFGADADEKDTPLKVMQALRPDVIFKGQDYTIDRVVGADFVQSYGGRVALIPLEEGFSTTATIKKMGSAA